MNTNPPPLPFADRPADRPTDRPDDARLSAWIDGELDGAGMAQVEAWLHDHPDDAARARVWTADRDALRALFDPVLDEPLPPDWLNTVQNGGRDAGAGAATAS